MTVDASMRRRLFRGPLREQVEKEREEIAKQTSKSDVRYREHGSPVAATAATASTTKAI